MHKNEQNNELLISLYGHMLRSRLLETRMVTLQRHGLLATYAGSSGQEALYVAIGHLLESEDIHVPYYRDQPCMLMRGYKPLDLIRYWSGDEGGNAIPNNDLPICVPIATQCLHAVGVAYALKLKASKQITLVTLGDGATSKGDFYEAMNFASLHNLPIIFVINDNGWAISTPLDKQTKDPALANKAIAFDMSHMTIDGIDLSNCLNELSQAMSLARNNQPVLVHAKTVRLCDHTTADDAKRYKSKALIDDEQGLDPLFKLKQYLINNGVWSEQQDQNLTKEINSLLDHDINTFKKETINDPSTMFEHCYANMPDTLKKQQTSLKHYDKH